MKDLGKGLGEQPFSKGFPQPPQAAKRYVLLFFLFPNSFSFLLSPTAAGGYITSPAFFFHLFSFYIFL